tara:strand:- start:507 stop:1088 length:582 start_codon:yes stop_codon:yes gene_type:complete
MNSKETLLKVKTLLGLEVQLEERKLENGTRFEADSFEAGKEVFIITDEDQRIAVPVGEYLLDDGMMLIVEEEGIIAGMTESEEEVVSETVEAPVVEEVEAAEVADIEDWRGLELRVKNLEDAISDLKADKENKVEASDDEGLKTRTVTEKFSANSKAIKHNPESKSEVKLNNYAQNRPMNTQDRVFAKLFNNN